MGIAYTFEAMSILHLWHSEKQLKSEPLGFVEDFCPVCREARRFTATNWFTENTTRVLLLIKVAGSREGGLGVAECPECRSRWRLERGLAPRGSKGREETKLQVEARLALEEKVRTRETTDKERLFLLLEPLQKMASMAEVHEAIGKSDPVSSWGFFGTVVLLFGGAAAIPITLKDRGTDAMETWGAVLFVVVGVCAALTIYAWFTRRSRYVRRELEPRVGRSVDPLAPSKHELIAAVEEFRRLEPEIGRRFDGARIHDRMRGVIGSSGKIGE